MPRLIDMLVTNADRGPPPKRIAPRRGDSAPSARVTTAHDSNIQKGHTMPKYQMALDAAPQDGRWLDDPNAALTVLQFLLSKLPPDQLAELDEHLTKGTAPQATDHRIPEGKLKADLLKYTPKNRRAIVDGLIDARRGKSLGMDAEKPTPYEQMFPNHNRLKQGY